MKTIVYIGLSICLLGSCQDFVQVMDTGQGGANTQKPKPTEETETVEVEGELATYVRSNHMLSPLSGVSYVDIPYGTNGRNTMDLFIPKSAAADGGHPLVVFFHGGGFILGNKNAQYKKQAIEKEFSNYLNKGIAVANVNYRLLEAGDQKGVMKCMEDATLALQTLKYRASDLGIDPNRIVLRGQSAGGSMSLWLGLSDDQANPNASDPVERMSTKVAAVVVNNTQSTLDIQQWENVFTEFDFKFDQGLDAEMSTRLHGMYGEPMPSSFSRSGFLQKTAEYRSQVDFIALMDAEDPPLFVANKPQLSGPPNQKNLLFHHRNHARYLRDRSKEIGGDFHAGNEFHFQENAGLKVLMGFVEDHLD